MPAVKLPPYPPVRPMDPEYISSFLSTRGMSKRMINGFKSALNRYNKSCGKAVDRLEEDLNKLLKY